MSFRLLFCPRIEWLAATLLTLLLFFNYNILTICYTLPNMQKKKKNPEQCSISLRLKKHRASSFEQLALKCFAQ